MNVNTPDGRIRRYGFEVVSNEATIVAIRQKFPPLSGDFGGVSPAL